MSNYHFGDDYDLNYYPHEASDGMGGVDWDKVESVEIEWVDFVRRPDDKSRWYELFGTPERAARTLRRFCADCFCGDCATCGVPEWADYTRDYDALLEWLREDCVHHG